MLPPQQYTLHRVATAARNRREKGGIGASVFIILLYPFTLMELL